jgi:D-sedoheptulose 7-phosphate isomerase/D-glycero-D-manno-heptose 1,7-bisphosphate phosphatase
MFDLYVSELHSALSRIPEARISRFLEFLQKVADRSGIIYIVGNGGSQSIGDHFSCDHTKGSVLHSQNKVSRKAINLSSMNALVSALENDTTHQNVYGWMVEKFASSNDGVLLISSSGKSANINYAKEVCIRLSVDFFILTGMEGMPLISNYENYIKIESLNYGIIEDAHMSLCHFSSQL